MEGKPRVLLVDDEPDVLQSLGACLAFDLPAVDIVTAQDGQEALSVIHRAPVDVVVTDYKMPKMDGLELVTRIHQHWPRCNTILMTAYADPQLASDAIERGRVRRFLNKPFEPEDLAKAVGELLP